MSAEPPPPPPPSESIERILIGSCILNAEIIAQAVLAGITKESFESPLRAAIWEAMVTLFATQGQEISAASLLVHMRGAFPVQEVLACENSTPTSAPANMAIESVLQKAASRALAPIARALLDKVESGATFAAVLESVEEVVTASSITPDTDAPLTEIVAQARASVDAAVSGEEPPDTEITTGLLDFDRTCTPMRPHEIVVVGARTSHGKSSFLAQVAGHNLQNGLSVVYFTLETSAQSVVSQIAAQRSAFNLRDPRSQAASQVEAYREELTRLSAQKLVVLAKDLSLDRIQARCALLAHSIKPDLVVIDYLGLIQAKGDKNYERMSRLSKAMIPISKQLGCTLMIAAQLNRSSEAERRAPKRVDFRDSGSIEEDASRVIALYRPEKDDRPADETKFFTQITQLKLRDGPLGYCDTTFDSTHTRFYSA